MRPFIYLSDLVLFNSALFGSYWICDYPISGNKVFQLYILIANLAFITASRISENYILERPIIFVKTVKKLLATVVYQLVFLLGAFYMLQIFSLSTYLILLYNLAFIALSLIHRSAIVWALEYMRSRGYNVRRVALIGDDAITSRLRRSFLEHSEYGYRVVHAINENEIAGFTVRELVESLRLKMVNEAFICYKQIDNLFVNALISECDLYAIKVKLVSDLLIDKKGAKLINYNGIPVLALSSREDDEFALRIVKRAFDIAFAAVAIVLCFPAFLVFATITKLTSPGPVFYRQQRLGLDEEPFTILKFRSMYVDAEKLGPQLATDNDPRITSWGRFMRKTRIDELPQFWNVLKGEMSMVGPRPERRFFIDQLLQVAPDYRKLMRLKPGVTSVGQVNYGYAENIDQMRIRMEHDLNYKRTLKNDIHIIIRTVRVMLLARGR